jgi:hypothetical protein
MLVEVIFQYRSLIGKCELGVGLDWEEIEQLDAIESRFEPKVFDHRELRRFRRETADLSALVRGDRINDRIQVVELALGGVVVRNAPYIAKGEQVELVVEEGDMSYRFRAQGVWLREDGDDYRVGLALIGMPIGLHKVAISAHQLDVVDKLAAA